MSAYRISPAAEIHIDDIWLHIARESGSIETAVRAINELTDRFWLLAQQPYLGRRRTDLSPELRSLAAGNYVILYLIEEDDTVVIHSLLHGRRDIDAFFHS